jgi:hypothetical protein
MPRETRSGRPGSAGVGEAGPSVRAVQQGILRKEGEYWTVGYRNSAFRLRDTKGLAYLAHLLRHPGTEFHTLDLVGGIASDREENEIGQSVEGLPRGIEALEKEGIHVTDLGDAGEMLDDQAKVAYRRRRTRAIALKQWYSSTKIARCSPSAANRTSEVRGGCLRL